MGDNKKAFKRHKNCTIITSKELTPNDPIRGRPRKCQSCDLKAGPWGHGAMGPWGHGAMGPGCIRTVTYKIGQTITVQGAVDSGSMCPIDSW